MKEELVDVCDYFLFKYTDLVLIKDKEELQFSYGNLKTRKILFVEFKGKTKEYIFKEIKIHINHIVRLSNMFDKIDNES